MNEPPNEHQKLLRDIDRLMSEATDEASRRDLERLRASLNSPQMLEMARELAGKPARPAARLLLEFHDPWLPLSITATGCVIFTALCLFAVLEGFRNPWISFNGFQINLWLVAALAGGLSILFTALSFMRSFSVRCDTEGMVSQVSGSRWRLLRVGAMQWKQIRSLVERSGDRVLEVHARDGEVFDIPMRVANYPILRDHLENMVRLFG